MPAVFADIGYARFIMVCFPPRGGKKIIALACFVFSGCALIVDLPEPLPDHDAGGGGRSSGGVTGSGGMTASGGVTASGGGMDDDAASGGITASGGSQSSGGGTTSTGGGGGNGGSGGTAVMNDASTGGTQGCVAMCDCDGDTYLAEGPCNGNDCDDNDSRANPDEIEYYAEPTNTNGDWDFNCDGREDKDPNLNVSAPTCLLPLGGLCPMTYGYAGQVPGCGGSGTWATCTTASGTCSVYNARQEPMLCR